MLFVVRDTMCASPTRTWLNIFMRNNDSGDLKILFNVPLVLE